MYIPKRMIRKTSLQATLANTRGMTIVEIMIVLTIIASIMGVVGITVFGAIDRANVKEAQIQISNLSQMVDTYYMTNDPRQFPGALEDLTKGPSPLAKKVPTDPWGSEYVYKVTSNREFEIYSVGADGIDGSDDDVRGAGK